MRITVNLLLVGGALFLASATESRALPPRQHSVSGVIEAIDYNAHTITLAASKGDKRLVFTWKNHTRFSHVWSRICLGAFKPGETVKVNYRREIGRLVPREVSLRADTQVRCAIEQCCAVKNCKSKTNLCRAAGKNERTRHE